MIKRLKQWINKAFSTESCEPPFVVLDAECQYALDEVKKIMYNTSLRVGYTRYLFPHVVDALNKAGYPCILLGILENGAHVAVMDRKHQVIVEYILSYYKLCVSFSFMLSDLKEWEYGQWYIE